MAKNFFLLILLVFALKADTEFIFSYRLCVENAQAVDEELYVSRAMTQTNLPKKVVCKIKKKLKKNETILEFLKNNKLSLLKCFQKRTRYVNSYSINSLNHEYSQITVKTLPIRFTVKFNNDFAIISTFIDKR